MAETNFSYEQVQSMIKTAVESAVGAMNKMNPIEQRKFDEDMDREHRRNQMVLQLGKIEEEAAKRRKEGCTHLRYAAMSGKHAGEMAPKGSQMSEWMTGGQAYQNGLASLICLRCQTVWLFRPTMEYYNAIIQNGLYGEAPPSPEHEICIGCFEHKHSCKCDEINKAMRSARTVAA